MWLPDVTDEDVRTWGILLALLALGLGGAIFHSRHEWRALRHKLYRPVEGPKTLSRPSRLARRLASEQWNTVFREALAQSGHDAEARGNSAAAAAMAAVGRNAERLAPVVQEVALGAMTEGEVHSALMRWTRRSSMFWPFLEGTRISGLFAAARHSPRAGRHTRQRCTVRLVPGRTCR